jgi:hypothetical protein
MTNVKVLLVDGQQDIPEDAGWLHIPVQNGDRFGTILENIKREFEDGAEDSYDVVALGNHNEHGLDFIGAIPQEFLPRVVVLSNHGVSPETEQKYRALGITHFCLRGAPFLEFLERWSPKVEPVVPFATISEEQSQQTVEL